MLLPVKMYFYSMPCRSRLINQPDPENSGKVESAQNKSKREVISKESLFYLC